MAKDYFQDIIPSGDEAPRQSTPRPIPIRSVESDDIEGGMAPERSIRNIGAPERKTRSSRPPVNDMRDPSNFGVQQLPPKPKRPSTFKWWPWILALVLVIVLGGLALFMLRKTTVTVIPRSHTVVFDPTTSQFTAYPASTAATGTLPYTVVNSQLQDSQAVTASGTQDVETKAQGSITIYNDYSTAAVKLIANTRFSDPNGLIFRVPDAVVVPGKVGSTPGSVSVTVFADQAGQQYNIGPTARFTIPGLQSTPAMYSNVYAQSTASTTGGFSGQQAGVDPTTLANTQASLRSELAQEALTAATAQTGSSSIVLPGLIQISYVDLPQTAASNGQAEINEQATIQTPIFDANMLSQTIASNIGEDSQGTPLTLDPGQGFSATSNNASSTLGTLPLVFTLSGTATLVWQVDSTALAIALAGHDQNAFDTITAGFPGIQQAHARIEPFWKTSFPSSPSSINVVIEPPQSTQ